MTKHALVLIAITVLLAHPFAAQASSDDKTVKASANELIFAKAAQPAEVRWLPLASGNFLALQRDYLAAVAHGVAILLPELGTIPTAPNGIEQLRVGLNNHGWTTLSLMPPPRLLPQPKEGKDNIAAQTYFERLIERLISAQKASEVIGGKLIVVAQGSQVSYLAKAYLDQMIAMPDAFILLDAQVLIAAPPVKQGQTAFAGTQNILSAQISELPLKVLDIYRLQSNLAQQMALRKKLSIKNKQYTYRQSELFDTDNNRQLVKTVYGWLKSSGLN